MPGRKTVSSESKLRDPLNALFFVQGKDFRLETFDFPGWLKSLESKTDEEKVTALKDAAKLYKAPKFGLYTEREDKTTHHVDAPLTQLRAGVYKGSVPDIYPDDGPPTFGVCGVEMPIVSFTTDQETDFKAFKKERELDKKDARRAQINLEVQSAAPSNETVSDMQQSVPILVKDRTAIKERLSELRQDESSDDAIIEKLERRDAALTAQLNEINNKLREWSGSHDFYEMALKNHPRREELESIDADWRVAYLEFAHHLATEKGLTQETVEDWKKRAGGEDYTNAMLVVSMGNALLTPSQEPLPLTREDRRKADMKGLKN